MAKGEHKKVARPTQDGYTISLIPEGYTVTQVKVQFGPKDREIKNDDGTLSPIYRWDRTIGPVEVKPGSSHKALLTVDTDQLSVSASDCFYQLVCEIERLVDEEIPVETLKGEKKILKTGDKILALETLLTTPTLLTQASKMESIKQNAAQTTVEGLQAV
ncbi:MAG: hypothetical protein OEV01_08600 [Nitrospira sp.]|nr:hypothetical protein [Nitrospira sp.]MDH4304141.1 hypothetical protein [Nitrospira sp.]MDH5192940.1 hypothetical protein [Nitrospira sp.]